MTIEQLKELLDTIPKTGAINRARRMLIIAMINSMEVET